MQEENAEYSDLWSLGLAPGLLETSGFVQVDPAAATIVPNYFEPFAPRNARIVCAYKSETDSLFRAFRADGDQDRPNRLEMQR